MKNLNFKPVIISISVMILIGCSSKSEKKKKDFQNESEKTEIKNTEEKKSITEDQALSELKKFIINDKKKFSKNGQLKTIKSSKGDYDGDGLDDFFFTAYFLDGNSEIEAPAYFYWDSQKENILSLSINKELIVDFSGFSVSAASIESSKIKKGEVDGKCFVNHQIVGNKLRDFNVKFSVTDSKVLLTRKDVEKARKLYYEMDEEWNNQRPWGAQEEMQEDGIDEGDF